jgi:hypothetical protein
MARITTYDKLRGCYVIEPDNNQNHIQRLGELEDKEEPKAVTDDSKFAICPRCKENGLYMQTPSMVIRFDYCPYCGQHLKWGDVDETL